MAYQRSQGSTTENREDKYMSKIASIKGNIIKEIHQSVIPQSNVRARREVLTDNRILLDCMDAYVSGCTTSVKGCIAYSHNTGSLLPCNPTN